MCKWPTIFHESDSDIAADYIRKINGPLRLLNASRESVLPVNDEQRPTAMPSLTDTLAVLSHQSQQITELSSRNIAPAGPFVQALLYTASVLSLIRDAQDSEARLFKFIGEEYGGKKVEKKDGTVLTPLKELKRGKVGGDQSEQVAVMLRTALRLVDD